MADEVLSQAEIEALLNQQAGGEVAADASASAAAAAEPPQETQQSVQTPQITSVPSPAPKVPDVGVRPAEFAPVASAGDIGMRHGVDLILDVQLQVAVELGRASLQVREVLGLGPGKVVELDKHAGEPVEVVINNKVVARGEVVVIDENFGVRITEIVNGNEREAHAKAA
ncbi:MAG: flagellar motor switch protein FliN [Armatimonadota bacterium]|nr:flagellar motor switch protein FliN [bacterium]